jgi:hypothetical protein
MVLTGAVVSRGGGLTVTVLDAGASAFPAASTEKYRTVVVAPSSKGPVYSVLDVVGGDPFRV